MKEWTLQNGLRVLFVPQEHLHSATVGVWVASGSVNETERTNGISHFIEHIVFKGTARRSAFEIAREMDSIGASVNAYTTKEYTFFYVRALSHRICDAADILFDMVLHPKLDESDIDTERGVILEEIAMCEDDPADVCFEANESAVFSPSPLSLQILGTKKSVKELSRSAFEAHRSAFYTPERMVVGVGGKFDEAQLRKLIEASFGALAPGGQPLAPCVPPFQKQLTLLSRPFEQTHLMLCFPGVPLRHDDLYVLQVLMFLLGTGTSSQLNQRLREELGLVYSVDAWLGRFLAGGYIAVSMSLTPESQKQALQETLRILRELPETIDEEALSAAKEKLSASLIMHREQPHSKLSSFGHDLLMFGNCVEDEEIIAAIRAVALPDVQRAAKQYLQIRLAAFTAVGAVNDEAFYRSIFEETGDTSCRN